MTKYTCKKCGKDQYTAVTDSTTCDIETDDIKCGGELENKGVAK